MTDFVYANNVSTTLAAAATSGMTTLTLASSTNLPMLPPGYVMALTLNDAATRMVYEIVYVIAITGTTLTVMRAQEGTTAQNWAIGDYAFSTVTAGQLTDLQTPIIWSDTLWMDTGAVNALAITLTPAPTALTQLIGVPLRISPKYTVTGAATLTINAFAPVPLQNPNGMPLVPNQMMLADDYVVMYNGTAAILQSISGSTGIEPVVMLTAAGTLTVAQTGALVELNAPATETTMLPSPLGNAGTKYRLYAMQAIQDAATPAGEFTGPNGSLTSTLAIPMGATVLVESDGTNWVTTSLITAGGFVPAGISNRTAMFTANAAWTAPAGVTKIYADAAAGGGGGSYSVGTAGGGGAAALESSPYTVVPGTVYTITIGASGAGGTSSSVNGTAGGTTSMSSLFTLAGGGGAAVNVPGAAGGTGGSPGGVGAAFTSSIWGGGVGGNSLWGAGGGYQASNAAFAGLAGSGFGAGGAAGNNGIGGAGSPGFVRIYW
jgi:hypothetical protein